MVSVAWIIGAASIVDFGIQFVGWAISSAKKTEKYYDLCGSGAFAAVAASTFACTNGEPRAALATTALLAWALRLGTFLVTRVHKDGGDKRFDGIKEDPATFGIYWFIQGIWVLVTAMPVILINANAATQGPLRALDWVGFAVFAAGLTMETVADQQKRAFKADAKNKGKYIDSGLWSISRHPNYFGEITLWTGMSMVGLSGVAKYGAGEVIGCVLSPLLVAFLITQLSGIPLLEKSADERWGNEEAYQKYKRETPKLIPFIGGK
jgi:steroid 5-alpha reductase family enzyme